MPLIKQKPSLNHEVIKSMTLKDLVDQHPLADEDHLKKEWHIATGKVEEKPGKAAKE